MAGAVAFGIVAVLLGAVLVFFCFPKVEREKELLARYHADDVDPGAAPAAFVVAAVVFAPFLFDTAFTLLRRARARKNVFSAHREHIYQRITPDPAKHRQVTNVYLGLSALCGLAASFGATGTVAGLLAGGTLVLACCLFMAFLPLISRKTGYG